MIGLITAGEMSSISAAYDIDRSISGLQIVSKGTNGRGFGNSLPAYPWDFTGAIRAQPSTANASWKACAYGNAACPDGGNVHMSDFASLEKRFGMEYDPINNLFVLQSIEMGVSTKPLAINPAGGNVQLGRQSLSTKGDCGFPYIPATNGAPTGIPADVNGMVPMQYDRQTISSGYMMTAGRVSP